MSKAYQEAEERIAQAKATQATALDLSFLQIREVPESIKILKDLQSLHLSANQISDISFLSGLTGLQSLDLSGNQISDISFLSVLTGLHSLHLSANQISDISFLSGLAGLQSLHLSGNQISDISFLSGLTGLQSLDLSGNQISDISFLSVLTGLHSLDLSYNKISDISFLSGLTGLQSLHLSYNQISDYSFLSGLTGLQSLHLRGNQISDISFLSGLTGLHSLHLSANQISDISFLSGLTGLHNLDLIENQISDYSFLSGLTGLQSLHLSYNQISDYSFLSGLTGLQSLHLRGNQISDISFLSGLTGLHSLHLSANQISDISFLSVLTGLHSLDLSYNQISDISFLSGLTGLQNLHLSYNQISDISFLSGLTGLQSLHLRVNQISDISFLSGLTGLQSLHLSANQISDISPLYDMIKKGAHVHYGHYRGGIVLEGNPVTIPPLSIVKEGREAILNYFDQVDQQGEAPLFEAKLMILGQGGAGKTTFARLQIDPKYDLSEGDPGSTLGIEIHEGIQFSHQHLSTEKQQIDTRLWDFGGQNIQKMLHQFFITTDCLYVLVCDKRKENTDFDYWFQIINLLGPGSPVIVLENQTGAVGNNERFALNKYQSLFKGLSLETEEVNLAKTRSGHKSRWKKLNELIAEKLSDLEIVNRNVPAKWSLVRKRLAKLQEQKYLGIDEYYELCKNTEIGLNKEQARLCLSYLKALGDLVHFEDHDLDEYVFLDHNWLTEGVYYILTDERIEKSQGRFSKQQAKDNWEKHNYSEREKSMLLRLMLKNQFDLCYEVEEDVFITPLLLPNDRPKNVKPVEANLYFRFQYGFMPHGMFSRAIVRLHEKIDGQKRWKSGVILRDQETGAKAEVLQFNDPKDNQQVIDVKISGTKAGRKSLLDFVRENIEHLHKEFKNLNVQRKVGCNCPRCQELKSNGEKPSFYDYEELQTKIQHRRYFVDCPNDHYNPVNIGRILSEVVTEDAGEKSIDSELLYRLKEMGMSINQIINNNKNEVSPTFHNENKPVITNTISVEVKVQVGHLLDEMSLLKQDMESELELEGLPQKEIKKLVKDVQLTEQALEQVEKTEMSPERAAKTRIGKFFKDLQNEESPLRNALSKLRDGKNYAVGLAEKYNEIANTIGLNPVPKPILQVLKSI